MEVVRFVVSVRTIAGHFFALIWWIIRNNELIELASFKVSIGGYTEAAHEFAVQEFDLRTNDCIYLFTDGYADQFGGPERKKMMTKRFKEIFLETAHRSMREQKEYITGKFDECRGNPEQVDDVRVMGIRV